MSININYLGQLPIENISLNTIPLAILLLGLAEFLLFHVTLEWGRKIYHFFSGSKSSNKSQLDLSNNLKALDGKKYQDLDIPCKQLSYGEKICDGSICREEVDIVLQSLGIFCHPEGEKLQERSYSADLVKIFEENKPSLDEVKGAFDVFDENKDGFIDASELQRVLLALGLKEGLEIENCRRMISVYDESNDGRIDFDEFVKFMENINF